MAKKVTIVYFIFGIFILNGCSKLDEKFLGDTTQGGVASSANTTILLRSLYNSMTSVFTWVLNVFPLQEICTDEAIFPTRAGDWDDNGIWRSLHSQKWAANHDGIKNCFNSLNGINYEATDLLQYHPSNQQQAEARFIRAWVMYLLLDMYDQVPYRDPGENLTQPARVRTGTEALSYIISELNAIESDLPVGPPYKANKYAAKVLLMKCYLNKMVYENRSEPVPNTDNMNEVIGLADEIITSGAFTFSTNYFDNFAPDNTTSGKENIFTLLNEAGSTPHNSMGIAWFMVLHYNQDFGIGVNGCSTLSDFYNKFEPTDKRRGTVYSSAGSPPNPANEINAGFLIGQQYDYFSGAPLTDRKGVRLLIFTPEVKNIETGANNEVTGIRPIKYFPDWTNLFSPDNDFVFFRLSDVLLMKAEAILRGGAATNAGAYGSTALSIINAIRTDPSRGASALASASLNDIYDERGRELWWENWRRQDMIRFKKFLLPFQEKNYLSDSKYLVFPIPDEQLAVNPNLTQNPGY
ncbi:MAG: RagB/SusD family nutrient uptake outer membrane protein [Chitinophagaceae bacterium]